MLLEMEAGGAVELRATAVCNSSSPLTPISPSLASPDCYKHIQYDINALANKQYVPQHKQARVNSVVQLHVSCKVVEGG